ncbi:universal stress protein [Oceanicola sp. D3]|uniref:universal stress protein n=1 Tax=Oceanicola sp. D3 TaxID=2587163 RepID=UPI0011205B87|nr:universal stress protein [Oceanicola sp. D3]QDC10409.1 universal stress protein [Oceanicola sp. D3]
MTRILVATDLSERSDRALRRAYRLAEDMDAELTVLAVVDEDLPRPVASTMAAEAEKQLGGQCGSISERKAEIRVEIGEPVATITACATRIEADLVVLGVHRTRAFWDFFSGTTMERIVRASERPVLLAAGAVTGAYQRVLCGIDLSSSCAAAAQAAGRFAPEAILKAFHAVHVPYRGLVAPQQSAKALAPFVKEAERELAAWWEAAQLPEKMAQPVPMVGSVSLSLDHEIESFQPELIAVGAHGRAAISISLLGQFTESLIRTPPCDVLVVRR